MPKNEPVKLCWATPAKDLVGNALGYNTHIKYLKRFAEKGGHTVDDPQSNVVLHIVSADHFLPVPGKFNVLFTMWEAIDVPISYQIALNKADLIIVPCAFCKEIFSRFTKVPIEVCWHGTDTELYKFHDRTKQAVTVKYKKHLFSKPLSFRRFRFLWVGAPNPRKGYKEVLGVLALAEKFPTVEIYIKTTAPKISWWDTMKSLKRNWRRIFDFTGASGQFWNAFFVNFLRIPTPFLSNRVKHMGTHKNVVFDTRMLPKTELVELYKSANCFIFPTWGEGWGLTLSEAMATGCPCIATPVTGVKEFFNESVGYELKYEVNHIDLKDYNISGARVYRPSSVHLLERMIHVLKNYREALKKGRAAAERMATNFTWEQSGARLAEIIRSHTCTLQKLK